MPYNYKEARKSLGLSREKLSGLAKRAGIKIAPSAVKRLEDEGEEAVGTRGLSAETVSYIDYILGLGDFDAPDWGQVEKGAPILVCGEKGEFSFSGVNEDGSIRVFSNGFRNYNQDRVRLIAATTLPPAETAHLFERRTRGGGGQYASEILSYINKYPEMPHSVGALSVALGHPNAVVSRVVASLIKGGHLEKVGRGVVRQVVDSVTAPVPAPEPMVEEKNEDVPSF